MLLARVSRKHFTAIGAVWIFSGIELIPSAYEEDLEKASAYLVGKYHTDRELLVDFIEGDEAKTGVILSG